VIRGNVFDEPSVVVDTHVKRVSKRLGLTNETEPEKVEQDLMKILPKDHWILWNLQAISLGREICKAPSPRCESCFLSDYCRSSPRRKAESE
jgi:endonuclease-3